MTVPTLILRVYRYHRLSRIARTKASRAHYETLRQLAACALIRAAAI